MCLTVCINGHYYASISANEFEFGFTAKKEKSIVDWYVEHKSSIRLRHCALAEQDYLMLIEYGWKPEEARSILPNSLKTEIVITANMREWRHILKVRTSKRAHPQMRQLTIPLLIDLKKIFPPLFEDIE